MRSIMLFGLSVVAMLLSAGCGMPSFLITPVQNTSKLEAVEVQEGKGWNAKKIAIIEVEGMLMNAKTGGFLQATENKVSLFMQQMDAAAANPKVVAVVLRVNSPGGTVTASDTMYQKLLEFKKTTHKPVVASTQEVAASGAYYVACGADKIVAHPTSVIGSIGVIFETFEFSGAMSKLGIKSDAVKSGPHKDMGSPFKPMEDSDREIMQGMVNEYYARFTSVVTTNRPITDEARLKLVTDGRVFTGTKAVELGLADQNGLLDDAIDLARTMAKAPGAGVILYKRPYGYSGSIYASNSTPTPQANVTTLVIPGAEEMLPGGFYYLWRP